MVAVTNTKEKQSNFYFSLQWIKEINLPAKRLSLFVVRLQPEWEQM